MGVARGGAPRPATTATATIQINKIHYPVTVLGPGVRVGIWTQGCSIGCVGCSARDTWPTGGGAEWRIGEVVATVASALADGATGVTISGGEPFDQPDALRALASGLGALRVVSGTDFDILCYTGRSWRTVSEHFAPTLNLLDAVISEPYVARRPTKRPWRGSDNQQLHLLSERGRERFDETRVDPMRLQIEVADGAVWMIGMPRPGDLAAMEMRLREAGLRLEDVSWRS